MDDLKRGLWPEERERMTLKRYVNKKEKEKFTEQVMPDEQKLIRFLIGTWSFNFPATTRNLQTSFMDPA